MKASCSSGFYTHTIPILPCEVQHPFKSRPGGGGGPEEMAQSSAHLLCFLRTWVWFPARTQWLKTTCHSSLRDLTPSSDPHPHMQAKLIHMK
jgi:hypothetical protein